MTHADTLRGMEKAFLMAGSYERAGTCLAGANALDTLAFDTLEYGITFVDESTIYWVGDDRHAAERLREAWINRGAEVDPLVCRRVSQPWEVTDE